MPPTPKPFPVGIFALLILWLALFGHGVGFGKEKPENQGDPQKILILTETETAWLKDHPTIHLGIDPRFAPFEFIDKNGRYAGMAADYVQLLNERLGIQMQIVPGLTWNQAVTKAKSGEIDVLPCVGMTAERKEYLLFSEAYIAFPRVIITKIDAPFIGGLEDVFQHTGFTSCIRFSPVPLPGTAHLMP